MRFAAAALAVALALAPAAAYGNGRPAATIAVHFQPGAPQTIVLQMTWGLATSTDGGAHWYWSCEEAIGFGGDFDPDYALTASGLMLATTTSFHGLRMTRDRCTWSAAPAPLGPPDDVTPGLHIAQVEVAADGRIYAAASTAADMRIYVSDDDGASFAPRPEPEAGVDAWISMKIATVPAERLYLTGHRFTGDARQWILLRSDDRAASWTSLSTASFTIGEPDGELQLAAISPTDRDLVFARVFQVSGRSVGDDVYRSDDGGQTWERVFRSGDHVSAVVVRANGEVVLATRTSGVHVSNDGGRTFGEPVTDAVLNCLEERDGILWGCGRSFAPDLMALGTSPDAIAWTPVTRFDLFCAPVGCPAGTDQKEICADERWEVVARQYSISGAGCPLVADEEAPPKGCLSCSAFIVLPVALRRRRKRPILTERSAHRSTHADVPLAP